jgi:hypothetical protein
MSGEDYRMRKPISVRDAAEILGISAVAVMKRIKRGTLLALPLSSKGFMVCQESVLGEPHSPAEFERLCRRYISVPEACDIVCVTDGMVIRMLHDGRLKGFLLNGNAWAVEKRSAEENIREYMRGALPPGGRPRDLGRSHAPKKRLTKRAR